MSTPSQLALLLELLIDAKGLKAFASEGANGTKVVRRISDELDAEQVAIRLLKLWAADGTTHAEVERLCVRFEARADEIRREFAAAAPPAAPASLTRGSDLPPPGDPFIAVIVKPIGVPALAFRPVEGLRHVAVRGDHILLIADRSEELRAAADALCNLQQNGPYGVGYGQGSTGPRVGMTAYYAGAAVVKAVRDAVTDRNAKPRSTPAEAPARATCHVMTFWLTPPDDVALDVHARNLGKALEVVDAHAAALAQWFKPLEGAVPIYVDITIHETIRVVVRQDSWRQGAIVRDPQTEGPRVCNEWAQTVSCHLTACGLAHRWCVAENALVWGAHAVEASDTPPGPGWDAVLPAYDRSLGLAYPFFDAAALFLRGIFGTTSGEASSELGAQLLRQVSEMQWVGLAHAVVETLLILNLIVHTLYARGIAPPDWEVLFGLHLAVAGFTAGGYWLLVAGAAGIWCLHHLAPALGRDYCLGLEGERLERRGIWLRWRITRLRTRWRGETELVARRYIAPDSKLLRRMSAAAALFGLFLYGFMTWALCTLVSSRGLAPLSERYTWEILTWTSVPIAVAFGAIWVRAMYLRLCRYDISFLFRRGERLEALQGSLDRYGAQGRWARLAIFVTGASLAAALGGEASFAASASDRIGLAVSFVLATVLIAGSWHLARLPDLALERWISKAPTSDTGLDPRIHRLLESAEQKELVELAFLVVDHLGADAIAAHEVWFVTDRFGRVAAARSHDGRTFALHASTADDLYADTFVPRRIGDLVRVLTPYRRTGANQIVPGEWVRLETRAKAVDGLHRGPMCAVRVYPLETSFRTRGCLGIAAKIGT